MSRLPLEGMRVIEMGQIVAGPTAGLIFGDMGAEVIKVEPPGSGGPSRPGNQRNGSFFFSIETSAASFSTLRRRKDIRSRCASSAAPMY